MRVKKRTFLAQIVTELEYFEDKEISESCVSKIFEKLNTGKQLEYLRINWVDIQPFFV